MYCRQGRFTVDQQEGFTLLEVVAVFIVTAIVGSMLFSYVRSAVDHTGAQLAMARNTLILQQDMETSTSRYRRIYQDMLDRGIQPADQSILSDFKTDVAGSLTGSVAIDTAHTKFVTFSRNASTKTYTVSSVTDTEQSGSHLILVLQTGGQRVLSVFSDSDQ